MYSVGGGDSDEVPSTHWQRHLNPAVLQVLPCSGFSAGLESAATLMKLTIPLAFTECLLCVHVLRAPYCLYLGIIPVSTGIVTRHQANPGGTREKLRLRRFIWNNTKPKTHSDGNSVWELSKTRISFRITRLCDFWNKTLSFGLETLKLKDVLAHLFQAVDNLSSIRIYF